MATSSEDEVIQESVSDYEEAVPSYLRIPVNENASRNNRVIV
jgi:hypothetical protein